MGIEESYNICKNNDWNIAKIRKYAKNNNLDISEIIDNAKIYVVDVLGMSYDEIYKKYGTDTNSDNWLREWLYNDNRKQVYDLLGGGEPMKFRYELMKHIYSLCIKVDMDYDKIDRIANYFGISHQVAVNYARKYYTMVLGNSYEDWNKLVKELRKKRKVLDSMSNFCNYSDVTREIFVNNKVQGIDDFDNKLMKLYYDYYVYIGCNDIEMKEFLKQQQNNYRTFYKYLERDFTSEISSNICSSKKIAHWIGDSTYRRDIYERIGGSNYNEFIMNFSKKCYEYYESVDYSNEKLLELANIINMSIVTINKHIMRYASTVLKITPEEYESRKKEIIDMKRLSAWLNGSLAREEFYINSGCSSYSEFKEYILEYCYREGFNCNFDKNSMQLLADSIGISFKSFSHNAREYAINYLHIDIPEWNEMRNNIVWDQYKLKLWLSDINERKNVYDLLGGENYSEFHDRLIKYVYDVGVNVSFQEDEMCNLSHSIGVCMATLKAYIKEYEDKYLSKKKNLKK